MRYEVAIERFEKQGGAPVEDTMLTIPLDRQYLFLNGVVLFTEASVLPVVKMNIPTIRKALGARRRPRGRRVGFGRETSQQRPLR